MIQPWKITKEDYDKARLEIGPMRLDTWYLPSYDEIIENRAAQIAQRRVYNEKLRFRRARARARKKGIVEEKHDSIFGRIVRCMSGILSSVEYFSRKDESRISNDDSDRHNKHND